MRVSITILQRRTSSKMSKLPSTSKEIPLSLLLLLCFFLGVNSQANVDQEQNILLKLKREWRNPPFISSWNSSSVVPHCNWEGITCTDGGSVTGIELIEINITEKIPPFICDLVNLTHLNLSLNFIPGEFPTSLYNCSKLEILDLSQNYFIGLIPSDINRISTLRVLNLGANNFTGDIPPSIGRFPFLQSLQLFQNQFNNCTFPPEIGNLSNLEELGLAFNQFIPSSIPSEFGGLKKLLKLWMTNSNLIGEIPQSIGNLSNLKRIDLSSNRLNGSIPDSLFMLKNLTTLSLQKNMLSGEIPRKIETWNLNDIDLSMNILTGTIPDEFGKLKYLKNFDMYNNQLSGEIPASIGRIPTLIGTRLFRNNLTGVLPPDLGRYSKLEAIEVSENQLTGILPENLCAGGAFYGLVAFSNNLNGTLPKSLLNCSSLYWVMLQQNKFSGEIPAEFWSLRSLSTVILRDNSFSGEFPDEMGAEDLERIEISNNRFYGRIPPKIAALEKLNVFVATNNLFSGEIPVELTALSSLLTLSLDANRLSGQFPSEIISWRSLNTLNLSRNQLTGVLPPSIGFLPSLNSLDLSENQFFGEIPPEFGSLGLPFLNLSSNRLTGRIPPKYENLAYDRSFLYNPGLCADNPKLNIDLCFVESRDSRKLSSSLRIIIIVSIGAILLACLVLVLFVFRDYRRKRHGKDLASWKLTSFQRLDFTETKILSSLTENNVIGSGGSGKVYRVLVNQSGNSYVAVKKIWSKGKLDQKLEKEFQTEVQILGTIRHSNIVKLLCCISSDTSKILVYEYMENSSLDQWLHRKKQGSSGLIRRKVLDWPKRLDIAVGAAQGLSYLHHNCSPPIVHRDVKSSNILLDSEFKARIADFGVAKMLVKQGEPNTASVIAGSFGYMAPEYGHTTKINEKIDVYSFGVVLLELATGREPNDGDEHTCLAEWAWRQYQEGHNLDDALDEDVKESCYMDEMRMVFKLGLICTGTLPSTRPSMKEILQILLRHDPMRAYGDKKPIPEYDVAPLLNDSASYLSSYKGSQRKITSSDVFDDDETLACNV